MSDPKTVVPHQEDGDQGTTDTPKDDPIALFILSHLAEIDAEQLSPDDIARAFAETKRKPGKVLNAHEKEKAWLKYLPAIRQQALFLARHNRLHILRKGVPADPHAPIKGLVKLSLPK